MNSDFIAFLRGIDGGTCVVEGGLERSSLLFPFDLSKVSAVCFCLLAMATNSGSPDAIWGWLFLILRCSNSNCESELANADSIAVLNDSLVRMPLI